MMIRNLLIYTTLTLSALAEEPAYQQDFEKLALGDPEEALFVVEGEFEVATLDDEKKTKALRLPATPLIEGGALFGKSSRGAMTVSASIKAAKKRRSYPRFGLGVHGISGYRLRVTPATKQVELVKDEESVLKAAYDWKANAWVNLKLSVRKEGDDSVIVEGWVWPQDSEAPKKPTIELKTKGTVGQGKASLWGTPYSGSPIWFDNLQVILAPKPTE